jgi:hypothetical protein
MAELKTKQNDRDVAAFLDDIADDHRRKDCLTVAKLMKKIKRAEPKM